MTDRVFKAGEDKEAVEELRKHDTRVLFDGRTVVVESVFHTIVDANILASRLREACAGPKLRLNVGAVTRRAKDYAITVKSFINTDEPAEEVGARVAAISPKPSKVTAGLADPREAAKIWAELTRIKDGGD
jgi:hypothetical protein